MNTKPISLDEIKVLVDRLGDPDGMVREISRKSLVEAGDDRVVQALVQSLTHAQVQVRWEAALALQVIADPVAAPALLRAMEDADADVRWVAARALAALGMVGLRTVLSGITQRSESVEFRISAHHVLHELQLSSQVVGPVLESLKSSEPAVTAPPVAYNAILKLDDGHPSWQPMGSSSISETPSFLEDEMPSYYRSCALDE